MTDSAAGLDELERVPTGIRGIDTILFGGVLRGGVYIIQGPPGSGKTILGNQLCFNHIAAGGRAIYVTLLAESHSRMMQNLRPMRFFDLAPVPKSLYYVSAFRLLEEQGLAGLLDVVRREVRAHKTSLLILDGLVAAEEVANSGRELKKFIHELQILAGLVNCTMFLLTNGSNTAHPEHTMVDGLFELYHDITGLRAFREIEAKKFRGGKCLGGRHSFRITDDGIEVYPRIEAVLAVPSTEDWYAPTRISTGVPRLDEMLRGGLIAGTTTMLLGPSGTGKTTLGLQFLSASSPSEPGLLFGFYETPARLLLNAASIGLPVAELVKRGDVELLWQPLTEDLLDRLGQRLLDAVRRRKVRRLFVDGISGMQQTALHPERLLRFFTALANELRALGTTTLYTSEAHHILGQDVRAPLVGLSSIVENLIVLRFLELRSQVYRALSILKARGTPYDASLREFAITDRGVDIAHSFESAESLLQGVTRAVMHAQAAAEASAEKAAASAVRAAASAKKAATKPIEEPARPKRAPPKKGRRGRGK
jgi:circadian clock protein KaiC